MQIGRWLLIGASLLISNPSFGQTADEIFDGCRDVKMIECRQMFGASEETSSKNCTSVLTTCELETKRRCMEGNGEISGCSAYGVSGTFGQIKPDGYFPKGSPGIDLPPSVPMRNGHSPTSTRSSVQPNREAEVSSSSPNTIRRPSESTISSERRHSPESTRTRQDEQSPTGHEIQPASAAADPSTDINQCASLANAAVTQCTSDDQTAANTGPARGQSIQEYCAQLQEATEEGARANEQAATKCYNKRRPCETTCDGLYTKYQNLLNSCGNCSMASAYQNALASLEEASNRCADLEQVESTLMRQATKMAGNTTNSSVCGQVSQSDSGLPGNRAGANAQGSPGHVDASAAYGAGAGNGTSGVGSGAYGDGGFQNATAGRTSRFALNDNADAEVFPMNYGQAQAGGGAAQVKPVPNGSGAGLPAGAPPANARAAGKGLLATIGGFFTDILQGFTGGGYSASVAQQVPDEFQTTSPPIARRQPSATRLDLKKYLPGQALDPRERPAGTQIHGRSVDIWARITVRMHERCLVGLLFACR